MKKSQLYVCVCFFFCLGVCVAQAPEQKVAPLPAQKPADQSALVPRADATNAEKNGRRLLDEADHEIPDLPVLSSLNAAMIEAQMVRGADVERSTRLLVHALNSIRLLDASFDPATRKQLKSKTFNLLLDINEPEAVKMADSDTEFYVNRKRFSAAISHNDLKTALSLVDSFATAPRFPFAQARKLIQVLPASDRGEITRIFMSAYRSYRNKDSYNVPQLEDLATFMTRYSADLPKPLMLEAIETMLKDAQDNPAEKDIELTVDTPIGQAFFSNVYQMRLFQLLPILKRIDEGRADSLLKENEKLSKALEKFPGGLNALQSTDSSDPKNDRPAIQSIGFNFDAKKNQGRSGNVADDQKMVLDSIKSVVAISANDLNTALTRAKALPIETTEDVSPRASALVGIFDVQFARRNREAVTTVLTVMLSEFKQLPALSKVRYMSPCVRIARGFLSDESAREIMQFTFDASAEVLHDDENEKDPNQAAKPSWPSTVSYEALFYIAGKYYPDMAEATLRTIPDAEVRTFSKLSLAAALLNLPQVRLELMKAKHKNNTNDIGSMPFVPAR